MNSQQDRPHVSEDMRQDILRYQRNEITEYHIYSKLARLIGGENGKILQKIANEEKDHSQRWKQYTGEEVKPDRWKIWKYYLISRVFGFTFGIQLMEQGEEQAQKNYSEVAASVPEAKDIEKEEDQHEDDLIEMLDEERLRYVGSIVLGLNDALVELTGALAGLTLALQNTRLVALTASITGVAAAMSMAASEYLSTKSEQSSLSSVKASVYTGLTYIITVVLLVLPYLLLDNYLICLAASLAIAVAIIALFTYYLSVAKRLPFWHRFLEMAGLSLGVALLSFIFGFLIRQFLGVEV